jgi:UDP-glucuronate decarboxylase
VPGSPVHYQHDPVQTIKTSVHGAINMLGLLQACLNAKILQASTSEVYGDPAFILKPRTIGATSIRSACGPAMTRASVARESLFFAYRHQC